MDYAKLIKEKITGELYRGLFGLEKENVRVDRNGHLALTPHPEKLGDKATHPYITVDFGESQIEMITPVQDSIREAYDFLLNIHDIVATSLDGEYLWPQSLPPRFTTTDNIAPADFPDGSDGKNYRLHLAKHYGKKRQLLSGIHFNFSFAHDFVEKLYDESYGDFQEFKNELYLHVVRNFHRYSFLLPCLFGAGNAYLKEFKEPRPGDLVLNDDEVLVPDMVSFRNSESGYQNKERFFVDYSSLEAYHKSLDKAIEDKAISYHREFYAPIRLKAALGNDIRQQIDYLEVRVIDLNPFVRNNVDIDDLYYLHMFLIYCLIKPDIELDREKYFEYKDRFNDAAGSLDYHEKTYGLHKSIKRELSSLQGLPLAYLQAIENIEQRCMNNRRHIDRYKDVVLEKGYIAFNLDQAKRFFEESLASYGLVGGEGLELSTQILIKGAYKKGLGVGYVDRSDNFIEIFDRVNHQYVKQATKTSLDSYMTFLIMENKIVSKHVLGRAGLETPASLNFCDIASAKSSYDKVKAKAIVIKPRSTNFGLGISIFEQGFGQDDFNNALDHAFKEDSEVLIEDFVAGKEYRFLVVDDQVVGVLHRKNAHVVGDGISTIKELVAKENENPLRGENYRKPLQKIKIGPIETQVLASSGLTVDSVAAIGREVVLRENSNISTGGVSIDFTDDVKNFHKEVAIKAARAAGAKICGVDMIIPDLAQDDYSIIEINFNPAIHIHNYPYQGKNRKVEEYLLKALGF